MRSQHYLKYENSQLQLIITKKHIISMYVKVIYHSWSVLDNGPEDCFWSALAAIDSVAVVQSTPTQEVVEEKTSIACMLEGQVSQV